MSLRTLVLNPDFSPIDIWSWQKTMTKTLCTNSVAVIAEYENTIRDGQGNEYKVPSIVLLNEYIDTNRPAPYSKANIYARDMMKCQYCGCIVEHSTRTIDHVIPRAHWNPKRFSYALSSFENVVTCCKKCNLYKRNRTPQQAKMTLLSKPKRPIRSQIYRNKILLSSIPSEWEIYIGKKTQKST